MQLAANNRNAWSVCADGKGGIRSRLNHNKHRHTRPIGGVPARAFLPMMYLMRRRFSGDKEHDGEGVLGRFASEDWGGVRPEGRESAGVGGTVLRELCLGVEDFLAKAADRADGAGGAAVRQAHGPERSRRATRLAEPGDGGGGSAVAPPVAGAAGPHAGGVAAGVMGSRGGALQYSTSVATPPAAGSAAKKSRSARRSRTRRKTGSGARHGGSRESRSIPGCGCLWTRAARPRR